MTDTIDMTKLTIPELWVLIQENFDEEPRCEGVGHDDPRLDGNSHDDGPAYWRMSGQCPTCPRGGVLLICKLKGDQMRQCVGIRCRECDAVASPEDWGLTLHKI